MKTICIVGGGNLAHVCAGYLGAQEGRAVRLLTRHPEKWAHEIIVTDLTGKVFRAVPEVVTSDAALAITNADIVLVALPGFAIRETLTHIAPFVIPKMIVGTVVSNTGFFKGALDLLPEGTQLFGFQRVPFIARVTNYGHSANLLGYKSCHRMAFENVSDQSNMADELGHLFGAPVEILENQYAVSLSNSNPLLHTARMYTMFADGDVPYDANPLFYEDWTDEASELYVQMDDELRKLLDVLNVSRKSVVPVLEYYESFDAASLTKKIRSIAAFRGIGSPMVKVGDKYRIDLASRYFTEDFVYGLKTIVEMMREHKIVAPSVMRVYEWGCAMLNKKSNIGS